MVNWTLLSVCLFLLILDWSWGYEIDSGFCGEPKAKPGIRGRIFGGESSGNGEWPWQVLIMRNGKLHGGGVLIEQQWILTAAHCIITREKTYSTKDLSFFVGVNYRQGSDENSKEVTASDFICHRGYDKYTFENDLCLVYLTKPLEFTNYFVPICLPSSESTIEVGAEAIATGWGITEGGHAADVLQKVVLRVTDRQDCSNEYYDKLKSRIPEKHFCAGDAEKDTCSGDSGGPLVVEETSSSGRVAFVLRGITSFGPEEGCAIENLPGTFVRVSKYLSWIYQEIYNATGTEPNPQEQKPATPPVWSIKNNTRTHTTSVETNEPITKPIETTVATYFSGNGDFSECPFDDEDCIPDPRGSEDICGKRRVQADIRARTVGGSKSYPGEWPWQVLILKKGIRHCGGTIIARRWILTAAHCIIGSYNVFDTQYLSFIVGTNHKDGSGPNSQYVTPIDFICHEAYRRPANDLCLVRLDKPIQFTDYVVPICLPTAGSKAEVGSNTIATGWGETRETGDAYYLQKVDLPIVETSKCNEFWYSSRYRMKIPDKDFCAGYEKAGKDTCRGDSGGPLVLKETVSGEDVFVLRGITSFGSKSCTEEKLPGVFVRASDYVDWIFRKIYNVTGTEPIPQEQKPATPPVWSIKNNTRRICGKPHTSSASPNKLPNGEMSKVEYMPWQVLIKERNGILDDWYHHCGGSLIDDAWIVTSARCLRRPLDQYSIFIGGHDHTNSSRKKAFEVQAHAFICHPEYNRTTFEHDVCLIKLAKPVRYSRHIIPICLPIEGGTLTMGKAAIGTGWGKPKDFGERSRLRKANLSIVDAESCSALFQSGIPKSLLCARYEEGSDPCEWDSGGQLVRKEEISHSEAYVLRGVASLSSRCSEEKSTHAYTRISNHLKWINKTISEMSLKTCGAVHSSQCGGKITNNTILRSPTKKEQFTYPGNTFCRWKIAAPSGYRLSFKFLCYFFISSGDKNCSDRLSITTDTGIKTLCGNELPKTFTVDSNISTVEFSTDHEMEYQGFVVEVKFLPPGVRGRSFDSEGGSLPPTDGPITTSSDGRFAPMNYAIAIAATASVMTFTLWY